jgi:hypothetical protein
VIRLCTGPLRIIIAPHNRVQCPTPFRLSWLLAIVRLVGHGVRLVYCSPLVLGFPRASGAEPLIHMSFCLDKPILAGFLGSFAPYPFSTLEGRHDSGNLICLTRAAVNTLTSCNEDRKWSLKKGTIFACPSQADASGSWQAYRITSSAWKRSVGGMVIPSAWAVFRLRTSSNFVGCSTGRSAGLAPFRILSTK